MVKLDETLQTLYYEPKGARVALGISKEKFDYWVALGIIQPVTLPGLRHRVYARAHIDALARHFEALLLASAKGNLEFREARVEDVKAENDLAVLVFGERAINPLTQQARKHFLEVNPHITYHLYEFGLLVASINIVPITPDAVEEFKQGKRGWLFSDSQIEQFTNEHPLHCIIIDFMTNPSVPEFQRRLYGMHLLSGLAEKLESWGAKGIEIEKVYASGGTKQGRHLLESAGFVFLRDAGNERRIYELDVKTAQIHLLRGYQWALGEYKAHYSPALNSEQ